MLGVPYTEYSSPEKLDKEWPEEQGKTGGYFVEKLGRDCPAYLYDGPCVCCKQNDLPAKFSKLCKYCAELDELEQHIFDYHTKVYTHYGLILVVFVLTICISLGIFFENLRPGG